MGYDYDITHQRREGFGQADGLSRIIDNQPTENEETVVAFVSVERDGQHKLEESNRNASALAEEMRKETEKDTVLEQALVYPIQMAFILTKRGWIRTSNISCTGAATTSKLQRFPYYGHKRKPRGPGYMSISRVRSSTTNLGDQQLNSRSTGLKILDTGIGKDPGGEGVRRTVLLLAHQFMLVIIEKGKDTPAKPTTDKRYLSLYSLLETFNLTHVLPPRSEVLDQAMVPSCAARTRMKPSRLRVNPFSKTYG
ncbi:hypothetical protein ACTXT7_001284 [Hymenolepis weldensis]